EGRTIKLAERSDQKPVKPTESFWKTTELPPTADLSSTPHRARSQTRSLSEADVRTLIIGPGVSVKGEITSCNRLIVQGKIEAKLADCPNVVIKEGASSTAKARLKMPMCRAPLMANWSRESD